MKKNSKMSLFTPKWIKFSPKAKKFLSQKKIFPKLFFFFKLQHAIDKYVFKVRQAV